MAGVAKAAMFAVTGGVNTHRGAIWALGLLTAAAVMAPAGAPLADIAALAGRVAAFPDRDTPTEASHGSLVTSRYGVAGARGEARRGFPNVVGIALPALRATREAGHPERLARLDALIALIAHVDDTCLLHRGGRAALEGRPGRGPSGDRGWRQRYRGGTSRDAVAGDGAAAPQRFAGRQRRPARRGFVPGRSRSPIAGTVIEEVA